MVSLPSRAPRAPAVEPAPVNAPLFRRVAESLRDDRRLVVLDLGPARSETVALLTPFRCRLEIADLADGLPGLDTETDFNALRDRAEDLLPTARREPVDLVLCWDTLNYLQKPALTALAERIAARMRPGGCAHLLIHYSGTTMPARPSHWAGFPDGRLVELPTTDARCASPRYSPEDLGKCLRGFRPDTAMLLRNGMQEFLFRA